MGFHITKKTFADLYHAFDKYCKERTLFGILLTIISCIISLITFIIPEVSLLLHEYLFWILIFLFILLAIFLYHFYTWKQNNFFTTNVSMESMLIIDGKDDNKLTFNISHLIVPSEDTLFLTLKLEFDEDVQRELKGNCYFLIFSKPDFLEMSCRNSQYEYETLCDGINKEYYALKFKYNNNTVNSYRFNLEASSDVHGHLKLYFLIGEVESNFEDITIKKSSLWEEDILVEDINIDSNDCIVIDKRTPR